MRPTRKFTDAASIANTRTTIRSMRSIWVFTALLFCGLSLSAQGLSGRVVDALTGDGIAGAMVHWEGTAIVAETDQNGHFEIKRIEGEDILVCRFVGYEEWVTPIAPEQRVVEVRMVLRSAGPTVVVESETKAQELNMLDAQKFQTLNEKELCKAACCSLSESFETNASVDASFTDAITGTRQIKMLGLDGKYTQVMFDNMPSVRGLSSIYGLSYLPGPWVREIAITKGAGSVIAGYESITGQINVAHKSTEMKERVFVNAYAGTQGRYELNVIARGITVQRWSSTIMAHSAMAQRRFDMNNDGFLDNPLFYNTILRNEWKYSGNKGLRGEYALVYSNHQNTSGQFDYNPADDVRRRLWGVHTATNRAELSAKTGYVFEDKPWKSFGSQVSLSWHNQEGVYGLRAYSGEQRSARVNLMYASEISEELRFTSGFSAVHDVYTERLDSISFDRKETVPGVFTELTWNRGERLSVVGGLRADHHNFYGAMITPRLHARWSCTDRISLKLAAGKGFRSPNLIMDHVGMLASNRQITIRGNTTEWPFGLKMEEAWTFGVVAATKFKLFYRDAAFTLDYYHTRFINQIVADWETPREIQFYNLEGESWSNSTQAELQWSPVKRMEWRVAYRWLDARTTYGDRLLLRPLIAQHRFFTNIAYETRATDSGTKWVFDATARWLGRQRLPSTFANPHEFMMHQWGNAYWIFNAQVARHFSPRFEVYVGGENLGNFMIMNPIISAGDPSSSYFDASLIWGPVFGRMGYAGLRWRIG